MTTSTIGSVKNLTTHQKILLILKILFTGSLDLASNKSVLRLEGNFWVPPIEDQLKLGPSHVLDYLRSETYRVYIVIMIVL